jgi:hypothetical protein
VKKERSQRAERDEEEGDHTQEMGLRFELAGGVPEGNKSGLGSALPLVEAAQEIGPARCAWTG